MFSVRVSSRAYTVRVYRSTSCHSSWVFIYFLECELKSLCNYNLNLNRSELVEKRPAGVLKKKGHFWWIVTNCETTNGAIFVARVDVNVQGVAGGNKEAASLTPGSLEPHM